LKSDKDERGFRNTLATFFFVSKKRFLLVFGLPLMNMELNESEKRWREKAGEDEKERERERDKRK